MHNSATINLARLDHLQRALFLAKVANISYLVTAHVDSARKISAQLKSLQLYINLHAGNPFSDPETNADGFVAITSTDVVIALKGSWELADWQNNLHLWQEACPNGGRVHAGYLQVALNLTRLLAPELHRSAEYANKQIWLTGHSCGGSRAILLAHQLNLNGIDIAGIYTYGAPKVSNATYARNYPLRERLHAFRATGDIVPDVPISHYRLHDWNLRYAEYAQMGETEGLPAIQASSAPGLLGEIEMGNTPTEIAHHIFSGAHSLTRTYIPMLETAVGFAT